MESTAPPLPRDIPAAHFSAEPFKLAPRAFLERHFSGPAAIPQTASSGAQAPNVLGTGAIVFDQPFPHYSPVSNTSKAAAAPSSPSPRVLLVQRAPHDSMPLRWEVPGGGCDEEDPSILYSCARELFEETGLKAVGVGPLVRCRNYHDRVDQGSGNLGGGGGGAAAAAEAPGVSGGLGGQFFRSRSGKLVCKFQFVVAVDLDAGLRVKLDPNEHFAYIWATEEEVRRKEVDMGTNKEGIVRADGSRPEETTLEFASQEQWDIVLDAFKLWRTSDHLA